MVKVVITIQSLEDAKNGIPLKKGVTPENTIYCDDLTVGILERGMQSGKTSLMFILEHEGKNYIAELSENLFNGVASALKGANERFNQSN